MIRLLIFLLAAGFGNTCNPSNAFLAIWLDDKYGDLPRHDSCWWPMMEPGRQMRSQPMTSYAVQRQCFIM